MFRDAWCLEGNDESISIEYEFQSLKKVNWASFQADVLHSELYTDTANTTDEFADQLDTVISKILDHHCPLQRRKRFASTRRDNRWLSPEAVDAKRQRRRLERRQSHSTGNIVVHNLLLNFAA